ncbi:MAG: hypothetical protein MMC33_000376 [Icmadophila ericetorum]|nr:hypothetical protein [Icmadophila ericetorum]
MAGEVRQPIDLDALSKYFGFGQSNPTYQLTASNGTKYVMRKKPPGRLLSKTAHQVEREYRIIHALENTDVPVPKAYALCEDSKVIGTPFYIMEFLDGRIFEDAGFPGVTKEYREEMWHDAIRTIAKLHRVNPSSVGLSSFGKPAGFYNRQLKTLSAVSQVQAETVDIESGEAVGKCRHFDKLVEFFQDPATQPKDRGTLIHGDYKIDNLVYHKTEPRVIGILDWEMSTIGHPLSDISNLLAIYTFAATSPPPSLQDRVNPSFPPLPTSLPGIPPRQQCRDWYADIAGWDPSSEYAWGDAFGMFRNMVIMQGIAARYALRTASSARAKAVGESHGSFADFTWSLVEKLKGELRGKGKGRAKL